MPHRSGYIIPNASDGVNSLQAEPDAGDFSILGNNTFGVLSGGVCGDGGDTSISITAGAFLIDGEIVMSTSGSVTLSIGDTYPRFDLVGYDTESAGFTHIAGDPSSEPKFAFIPDTFIVLAAVFIDSQVEVIDPSDIVDKRHLLLNGAKGSVSGVSTFIRNSDPDTGLPLFSVTGAGTISWGGTSSISSDGTDVTVSGKLTAGTGIDVTGNAAVSGNLTVDGVATSSNFKRGSAHPGAEPAVAGNPGDIYSRTNGQQFTYLQSGTWAEIYADEYPPGTVIASLLEGTAVTTFMGAGWLKFGATYADADVGRLASMGSNFEGWHNVGAGQWTLPDLSNTFLAGSAIGSLNGVPAVIGDNAVTISNAQLPSHKHFEGSLVEGQLSTNVAGSHIHTITSAAAGGHSHSVSGGLHSHPVNDDGHAHSANPYGDNTKVNFVATVWGGNNKLDGHFSDKSHTWTVDTALYTTLEPTGVTIPQSGNHSHSVATVVGHTHATSAASSGEHSHTMPTESGVGSGSPLDVTPKHLKVHYYLKV
jgi:hypothetical protein